MARPNEVPLHERLRQQEKKSPAKEMAVRVVFGVVAVAIVGAIFYFGMGENKTPECSPYRMAGSGSLNAFGSCK